MLPHGSACMVHPKQPLTLPLPLLSHGWGPRSPDDGGKSSHPSIHSSIHSFVPSTNACRCRRCARIRQRGSRASGGDRLASGSGWLGRGRPSGQAVGAGRGGRPAVLRRVLTPRPVSAAPVPGTTSPKPCPGTTATLHVRPLIVSGEAGGAGRTPADNHTGSEPRPVRPRGGRAGALQWVQLWGFRW